MKALIILILSIIYTSTVFAFTQECNDTVNGYMKGYQKTLEELKPNGFALVTYETDDDYFEETYDFTGASYKKALYILNRATKRPALVSPFLKGNSIYRIDILKFKSYRELVFIIEPKVKEICAGQFKVTYSDNDKYYNEKYHENSITQAIENIKTNVRVISIKEVD